MGLWQLQRARSRQHYFRSLAQRPILGRQRVLPSPYPTAGATFIFGHDSQAPGILEELGTGYWHSSDLPPSSTQELGPEWRAADPLHVEPLSLPHTPPPCLALAAHIPHLLPQAQPPKMQLKEAPWSCTSLPLEAGSQLSSQGCWLLAQARSRGSQARGSTWSRSQMLLWGKQKWHRPQSPALAFQPPKLLQLSQAPRRWTLPF